MFNSEMAFWYVAPSLSEKFVGEARTRSPFEYQTGGVWRGWAWAHPFFLVSVRELPRNQPDSLPLLLLDDSAAASLAPVFAGKKELIERFGSWLVHYRPRLWKEVATVAEGLRIDYDEIAKLPDIERVLSACLAPSGNG